MEQLLEMQSPSGKGRHMSPETSPPPTPLSGDTKVRIADSERIRIMNRVSLLCLHSLSFPSFSIYLTPSSLFLHLPGQGWRY